MFPAAKDSAGKPRYPYHQSDISEEEFGWKGVGVVVVVGVVVNKQELKRWLRR